MAVFQWLGILRRHGRPGLGLLALGSVLVVCSIATDVGAQTAAETEILAVQMFDEGERLVAEGRFAEACPKYSESYRIDPQLGVLIYLAECLEKNGQLASAWARYREASEIAQQRGDERRVSTSAKVAELAPRLSTLLVRVLPANRVPGLQVTRGGAPISEAVWGTAVPLDPGRYRIEAKAPGHAAWGTDVAVADEANRVEVEVPKLAQEVPTAVPDQGTTLEAPLTDPTTPGTASPSRLTTPVLVSGLATVALGLGTAVTGVLYLSARGTYHDANTPSFSDQDDKKALLHKAERLGMVSTILGVGAVVGAALTTYLHFGTDPASGSLGGVRADGWVSTSLAGVMLEGAF